MISDTIEIRTIAKEHYRSLLTEDGENKFLHWREKVVFIAIPLFMSALAAHFQWSIKESITEIITTLAIFTGLLLNVNILLINLVKNEVRKFKDARSKLRKEVFKEAFSNISFQTLVAIVIIVITFLAKYATGFIDILISSIVIGFITLFMITLIMVINRVYILFQREVDLIK